MPKIRPLAICIFSHNGKILVCEGYDPTKGETFTAGWRIDRRAQH
jgi:hypothetical protein